MRMRSGVCELLSKFELIRIAVGVSRSTLAIASRSITYPPPEAAEMRKTSEDGS